MASATGIPPPSPMNTQGDAKCNWDFFEEQWSNYKIATELDQKTADVRLATLKTVIGKEGLRIIQHVPMTNAERYQPQPL